MIFDRLRLNPRIKKGRSTDKEILKSIANPPALVTKVLEYRTVQKEHSTYVIGLLDARDTDGRVRSTFSLHITATGRLSSKELRIGFQRYRFPVLVHLILVFFGIEIYLGQIAQIV